MRDQREHVGAWTSCLPLPRWLWPWSRAESSRVLLIGLDFSGKTTVLYKLILDEVVTTIPTIGYNVELLDRKDNSLLLWDLAYYDGAGEVQRPLWRHYYPGTKSIIFVVDAVGDRIDEARSELHRLLGEDELRDVVLLVYANKQDLPNARSCDALTPQLGLDSVTQRWHMQAASAISGAGLHEGIDWLCGALRTQ
jgi:ADP-ribosylation factor 1/2